jgi:HAD superfamily hydrolase (TIGR01549 family)
VIDAVIFDLDGVLIDSEPLWEHARAAFVREQGGAYTSEVTGVIMGMSAPEWAHFLRQRFQLALPEQQINDEVVARLTAAYRANLPLVAGAQAAVRRCAARFPLALASSSNRSLIDLVLQLADLSDAFTVTISSEEVGRGKPAPDVYLRAAQLLGVAAARCAAVEDSTNGLRSAKDAGCRLIAFPNRERAPTAETLALAEVTIARLDDLDAALATL